MYRKIDIYVGGEYVCSTCSASSLNAARDNFYKNPCYMGVGGIMRVEIGGRKVTCKYA